jgi:hypothetical protein
MKKVILSLLGSALLLSTSMANAGPLGGGGPQWQTKACTIDSVVDEVLSQIFTKTQPH